MYAEYTRPQLTFFALVPCDRLCKKYEYNQNNNKQMLTLEETSTDYRQRVWNRREIQLTRPALSYDYACFADGYSIRNIQNRL